MKKVASRRGHSGSFAAVVFGVVIAREGTSAGRLIELNLYRRPPQAILARGGASIDLLRARSTLGASSHAKNTRVNSACKGENDSRRFFFAFGQRSPR